ncbi:hypothetical protein MNAN1_000532 [Malassezia nana]|uniref:Uncharacterized protein n=1 Tax=Malassezia nana TaxID=180528 RepID=A0AAF0EFP8_9BASI|nr:hypothetical protein MNAN1_000532 [Malassezia nana]
MAASTPPAGAPHGSPASVEALAADMSRMPEALVICLVHDNPRLRESWEQLVTQTLDPLCCALAQLQSHTRLLVGGVVYRTDTHAELDSPLRPDESITRLAFAPAPCFLDAVRRVLHTMPMYGLAHLEAAEESEFTPSTLECALADPLAAALEMIEARQTPPPIAPFARSVLRTHHSSVVACHLVHVVALDTITALQARKDGALCLPTYTKDLPPLLHTSSHLDACSAQDLLERLGERTISLCTILVDAPNENNARQRNSLAHTVHDLLRSSRRADAPVPIDELLVPPWKAPEHVTLVLTSAEIARSLRKRPRRAAPSESPSKRVRGPETPPMPTQKVDSALLNKVVLLQQQQATMLKNLSRWAVATQASGASGPLQAQMIEQFRQRLVAQQHAMKQQAERLRAGKSTDLNLIWQALVTIDKEAKEAGLHLMGPSSQASSTNAPVERSRTRSAAPSVPTPTAQAAIPNPATSTRPSAVWQGILKWAASGTTPLFTLVVAMTGGSTSQTRLGLPWPNVLTIRAWVPFHPSHLQRLITSNQVPYVLLTLRPFPPSLTVHGSENNESNYVALHTMLDQHQRAAFVPHGDPGCGLLVVALARPSTGSAPAPAPALRLLAMVFRTPIPFAQLGTTNVGTTSATNTRGIISVPTDAVPSTPVPPSAPVTMPGMLGPAVTGLPTPTLGPSMPILPTAAVDPVQHLLHSTSMASSWTPPATSAPMPATNGAPVGTHLFTPEQLRALGL